LFRDWSHKIKSLKKKNTVVLVNLELWLNEAHIEPSEDLRSLPLRDEEHASHISVKMYGFKLEGGEWFKGGFRKLFRIE